MKFFIGSILISVVVGQWAEAKDAPAKTEEKPYFQIPRSTLDATERRLDSERRPNFRIDLLLRWIKSKEEYEQAQIQLNKKTELQELPDEYEGRPGAPMSAKMKIYLGYKQEIISRVQNEIEQLETVPGLKLTPLYREIAFRHLELHQFQDSIRMFERIPQKLPGDLMGLGDSYFSSNETVKALEVYEQGGKDPRFVAASAYKRAWCYLRLNQFQKALNEFDQSLSDTLNSSMKLKEEAFKDRIRPYVEAFSKATFEDVDAEGIRLLSQKVYASDPKKAKALFDQGLRLLVESFNAKAKIELAQNVFEIIRRESTDANSVLLAAAPLWIKVYRGLLDHAGVERILKNLPSEPIKSSESSALQSELYNSVVYYDTLVKEEQRDLKEGQAAPSRSYLFLTNKKYFQLFPDDPNADSIRIGYAKLLLEDGDPAECLTILSKRKGAEKEIEDLSLSYEAKCELKQLDQLYPLGPTDFFVGRLRYNMIEKKTYERNDLGLSSDQAFESLARMLIGAVKTNNQHPELRKILDEIIQGYPLPKEGKLFYDLQLLRSEVTFVDIANSKLDDEEKSKKFYEVFQASPKGTEVSKKSLTNSIVLSLDRSVIDRCEIFQSQYAIEFKPGQDLFERCIRLADRFFEVEKEYQFLRPVEGLLDNSTKIKLGLIELALEKGQGRKRLLSLQSDSARNSLDLWDGKESPTNEALIRQFEALKNSVVQFSKALSPVSFARMNRILPTKIDEFNKIESQLGKFYQSKPDPLLMAKTLEQRAILGAAMRDWMKSLPVPPGLSPEELALYNQKSAVVVQPWLDGAEAKIRECGEVAYFLSIEFKVEKIENCPVLVPEGVRKKMMEDWEVTRQKTPLQAPWKEAELKERTQTADRLLDQAKSSESPYKARYFLIRAISMAENDYQKARGYLGLAKLMNKRKFWETAASLDGNLMEAIQWKRSLADGNPFYAGIFDAQIEKLK